MSVLTRAWEAWQRFFFTPRSTTALAVVRIAFGLVLLVVAYGLAPDIHAWFGADGLAPTEKGGAQSTLFTLSTSRTFVTAMFALYVVAAVCVVVGLGTRVALVVVYVLLLSFQHRMPYVMNSGDLMLRLMLGLLCLAPAGAALSVDRWLRHRDDFWASPVKPVWALRLMQLQLAVIYLDTVWQKLRSASWRAGEAMYYGFVQHDLARIRVPEALAHNGFVVHGATWGLVAVELALALLVWFRRLRPWVLVLGVLAHVSGHLFLVLGAFSYVVLATYLTFLDPDWCDRVLRAVARSLRFRRPFRAS